jgi:hypothetical protein
MRGRRARAGPRRARIVAVGGCRGGCKQPLLPLLPSYAPLQPAHPPSPPLNPPPQCTPPMSPTCATPPATCTFTRCRAASTPTSSSRWELGGSFRHFTPPRGGRDGHVPFLAHSGTGDARGPGQPSRTKHTSCQLPTHCRRCLALPAPLRPQAASLGLGDSWGKVQQAYAAANRALGDIVKVTPSSKVGARRGRRGAREGRRVSLQALCWRAAARAKAGVGRASLEPRLTCCARLRSHSALTKGCRRPGSVHGAERPRREEPGGLVGPLISRKGPPCGSVRAPTAGVRAPTHGPLHTHPSLRRRPHPTRWRRRASCRCRAASSSSCRGTWASRRSASPSPSAAGERGRARDETDECRRRRSSHQRPASVNAPRAWCPVVSPPSSMLKHPLPPPPPQTPACSRASPPSRAAPAPACRR